MVSENRPKSIVKKPDPVIDILSRLQSVGGIFFRKFAIARYTRLMYKAVKKVADTLIFSRWLLRLGEMLRERLCDYRYVYLHACGKIFSMLIPAIP